MASSCIQLCYDDMMFMTWFLINRPSADFDFVTFLGSTPLVNYEVHVRSRGHCFTLLWCMHGSNPPCFTKDMQPLMLGPDHIATSLVTGKTGFPPRQREHYRVPTLGVYVASVACIYKQYVNEIHVSLLRSWSYTTHQSYTHEVPWLFPHRWCNRKYMHHAM